MQLGIDFHNRRDVSAAIAIIRRRPHRHEHLVKHVFVSFHHQLMRSADQIQVVRRVELHRADTHHPYLLHGIASKHGAAASRVQSPARHFFIRV